MKKIAILGCENSHANVFLNYIIKDKLYNDSFIDLYLEVVNKTKEMVEVLYDYIYEDKEVNLEKLFKNKSYGTGLILK